MSHRIGRVAHIIRDVVSDTIANRISDPRVSRFTSVTRVEVSPDLRAANVYVSVMGDASEGRTTMKGLESARGLIQSRVAKSLDLRQCPIVQIHLDLSLKRAAEVMHLIDEGLGKHTDKTSPDSGVDTTEDDGSDSSRPAYGDDE
ncbi:MAG TPA: 30S ribosome-binding factor RbfA [Phycisphaerae bacterium]|nr:30S ribosome-binding factor RbfA [Phycisphaerae bacterium]